MGIRGFVLGVALVALVGWCMVQETFKQTWARYDLAELARREDDIRKRMEKLRADEIALCSPNRLGALVREKAPRLVAIGSADPNCRAGFNRGTERLPGTVLDKVFLKLERPVRMASLGGR
ncbi:MAG: hypothetical protein LBU23_11370 [Planctomycetota bacterium]|jgi:hypothetical protein|nr:hypothetical protein [Planctomycetota bacterium]